jgi:small-conductance mechanosensitive channel
MEQIQAQLAQLIAAQQQQHVAMQQQQADNLALRNELVNAQQVAEDARQQSAALATQLAASTSAPSPQTHAASTPGSLASLKRLTARKVGENGRS